MYVHRHACASHGVVDEGSKTHADDDSSLTPLEERVHMGFKEEIKGVFVCDWLTDCV